MTTGTSPREGTQTVMSLRRVRLIGCGTALLAATWLTPASALASKNYPGVVISYWRVTAPSKLPVPGDGCLLCHKTNDGGNGTIDKPFGKTMQSHGLKGAQTNTLYTALAYVANHSAATPIVDSDHDAVPDYTEVAIDHTNPNDPKSFVRPPPVEIPPVGGAAGESGAGGAGLQTAEGGAGAVDHPTNGPVFLPPAAGELPPPFAHGCALARHRDTDAGAFGWLGVLALVGRRARRRRAAGHAH